MAELFRGRRVYREVRERFGLLAQHTIRAIAVVADSYKAERARQHTFRPDAAIVLDTPRLYRISHNRAGIATLDGRLKIQLGIGGHQRRMLADATKLAEADLLCDRKAAGGSWSAPTLPTRPSARRMGCWAWTWDGATLR